LTYRLKQGNGSPIVLLHGLTGDETVMWAFLSALPRGRPVAAPRAPFASAGGGYSWVEGEARTVEAYAEASSALVGLVEALGNIPPLLVGFSQGAAMAFAATALKDVVPIAVVALSGFLPRGDLTSLRGKPVFWAHGLRDDKVPVELARADARRLSEAGAHVEFCESDVGHKVGVECLRGLKVWLADIENAAHSSEIVTGQT
jgi:predicted esterase